MKFPQHNLKDSKLNVIATANIFTLILLLMPGGGEYGAKSAQGVWVVAEKLEKPESLLKLATSVIFFRRKLLPVSLFLLIFHFTRLCISFQRVFFLFKHLSMKKMLFRISLSKNYYYFQKLISHDLIR